MYGIQNLLSFSHLNLLILKQNSEYRQTQSVVPYNQERYLGGGAKKSLVGKH